MIPNIQQEYEQIYIKIEECDEGEPTYLVCDRGTGRAIGRIEYDENLKHYSLRGFNILISPKHIEEILDFIK